jgi:hypothetical protein
MSDKTKRLIYIALMAIPSFVLIAGGVMKLLNAEPAEVVEFLARFGFGSYMKLLGVIQLLIGALVVYPKTNKLGFLLASCFFSAALSLEIAGAQPPVSAFFLSLLWTSMFLKNRKMFLIS